MKTINHYLSKVLLGTSMLAMLLFAYSCSQETSLDPTESLEAHSAKSSKAKKATRAIRGKINNDADPSVAPVPCDDPSGLEIGLSTNFIYGNMTHLGKIQPGSFGRPIVCETFLAEGKIVSVYEVNYIGAHGDEIRTRENTIIIFNPEDPTFNTGTFEGTIEIIGGTGRFEGATGNMVFVDASFIGSKSTWEVVGEITY
ncbi:hypothetical protein [Maribacter arenosus]|uniref:Allene oxide cyclase barrel-like domain-containing protein n=1 Tax=Maribacter arenosus TaxID=1854708 RepID=A0ABR7VBX6_9FLAO|nr:hypothetical protein [Maribacter arenosus]MBD0851169.1 hypothetical protein [Maribacter arenosus]